VALGLSRPIDEGSRRAGTSSCGRSTPAIAWPPSRAAAGLWPRLRRPARGLQPGPVGARRAVPL